VAAYIETQQRQAAPPTVKQHMAAIRMLFSWLTEKGVLAMNPPGKSRPSDFRGPKGKHRHSSKVNFQRLLEAIETSTHTGLRDRALLGVLAYTFARIGAVVNPRSKTIILPGNGSCFALKRKAVKRKSFPCTTSSKS
jgi:site-specific recombinase XerD